MDRRSTSVKGFVHFGGDVRSGAEDGIGLSLSHATTGSTAWLESVSDDTNAHLGIRAQGAGTITVGNTSNAVTMGKTLGVTGNSTFAGTVKIGSGQTIKGLYTSTFAWEVSSISSGQTAEITFTTSLSTLLAPGDLVGHISLAVPDNPMITLLDYRLSSVATSILTLVVGNISSTKTDSESGEGRITWIDLT